MTLFAPTHRHYKGGLYRIIATGRVEADLTPVTIYQNEQGDVWTRPTDDFDGLAPDGVTRRFTPLDAADAAADTLVDAQFQRRVNDWAVTCFGPDVVADKVERNHRFLEESLELVQSLGCTRAEALELVDYVYGRPKGDPHQEVGGVVITLAALCNASGIDIATEGETELARIWGKIEQIRRKQATKPKGARPQ